MSQTELRPCCAPRGSLPSTPEHPHGSPATMHGLPEMTATGHSLHTCRCIQRPCSEPSCDCDRAARGVEASKIHLGSALGRCLPKW